MDRNKALSILLGVKRGITAPIQALDQLEKLVEQAIRDSQPPPKCETVRS